MDYSKLVAQSEADLKLMQLERKVLVQRLEQMDERISKKQIRIETLQVLDEQQQQFMWAKMEEYRLELGQLLNK